MAQTFKQSVEEALQAYSPLRTSRAEITVTVDDDGVVSLSGYAPSASIKGMAEVLASTVDGVSEVGNDLTADPDLERTVALALAADSRTRTWPIRVRSELGHVQLQGDLPDEEAVEAALEVARGVEGPKQIFNALKLRELTPLAA